jgi:hypothetical protein
MFHLLNALDLVVAACAGNYIDRVLVREAVDCANAACRVVAQRCSEEAWEQLRQRLDSMAEYMPLSTLMRGGPGAIEAKCSSIATSESFERTLGGGAGRPSFLFGDVLSPGVARDYTFIRGDDGEDYFLHRSELVDRSQWSRVGSAGWSRIRFRPGPTRSDKSPPARSAVVIHLESDE